MRRSRNPIRIALVAAAIVISLALTDNIEAQSGRSEKMPDINTVLAAHDQELLKLPNVTGVYVGLLEDGKTPCLKVMLTKKSPETEAAIPRTLEGYCVLTEVTGEIRPLKKR